MRIAKKYDYDPESLVPQSETTRECCVSAMKCCIRGAACFNVCVLSGLLVILIAGAVEGSIMRALGF